MLPVPQVGHLRHPVLLHLHHRVRVRVRVRVGVGVGVRVSRRRERSTDAAGRRLRLQGPFTRVTEIRNLRHPSPLPLLQPTPLALRLPRAALSMTGRCPSDPLRNPLLPAVWLSSHLSERQARDGGRLVVNLSTLWACEVDHSCTSRTPNTPCWEQKRHPFKAPASSRAESCRAQQPATAPSVTTCTRGRTCRADRYRQRNAHRAAEAGAWGLAGGWGAPSPNPSPSPTLTKAQP